MSLQLDLLLAALHPDVGEMLGLGRVHLHVLLQHVLANHHALVHGRVDAHEQGALLFHVAQGVGSSRALGGGDDGALVSLLYWACVVVVLHELGSHQRRASSVIGKIGSEAEHAARRHLELEQLSAVFLVLGGEQDALPAVELVNDGGYVLQVRVNDQLFVGLEHLLGVFGVGLHDYLGRRNGHLEALPAHLLDEDAQVQVASARDFHQFSADLADVDSEGDVVLGFPVDALSDLVDGALVAFGALEGGVVEGDLHLDHGRVDGDGGDHEVLIQGVHGVVHGAVGEAGNGDDVSRVGVLKLYLGSAELLDDFDDLGLLDGDTAGVYCLHFVAQGDLALVDSADEHSTEIPIALSLRYEHLQIVLLIDLGRRYVVDDRLEQVLHVLPRPLHFVDGPSAPSRGVDQGVLQLLVSSFQLAEKVEYLVFYFFDAGGLAVYLVHDHDGLEAVTQGLFKHELGLGHGTFSRADDQANSIHHGHNTLYFTSEVLMPRRIHDV